MTLPEDRPDDMAPRDVSERQQQVILQVLEQGRGQPLEEIEDLLTVSLQRAGLDVPPGPWVRAVAEELVEDRVYVVAKEALPETYADHPAAERARDRLTDSGRLGEGGGGDSEAADASAEDGSRRSEEAAGNFSLPAEN